IRAPTTAIRTASATAWSKLIRPWMGSNRPASSCRCGRPRSVCYRLGMVPRHTSTRPAVALALAAAALVALSSCRRAERPAPAPAPVQPPAAAAPVPPLGPVERAQLISAAASASDAYALGRPYPPALADLIGERFEARLPFGCAGEAPEADVGYTVDAKRGALSLQARPETWTTTPWVRALAGPAPIEAIEGFW